MNRLWVTASAVISLPSVVIRPTIEGAIPIKHVRFLASAVLLVVPLALYAQLAGTAGAGKPPGRERHPAPAAAHERRPRDHAGGPQLHRPTMLTTGVCTYAYDQAYGDCTGTHQATEPSLLT